MTADLAFMFLFGILLFLLYWQPTIIAWIRHKRNIGSIALMNGLLGWTSSVGWSHWSELFPGRT